ncbi:MAG: hypothetical protein V3U90_07150 [Dehalococcoidia bacterium]
MKRPEVSMRQAIQATIEANPEAVEGWMEERPGSWGYLAGQAVLAYSRLLGRRLEPLERKAVWASLWQRLEDYKDEMAQIER